MRKKLDVAAVVLLGGMFLFLMPWSRMIEAKNDFVHFYIGGLLYGHPDIFSPEANFAKQRELIGGTLDNSFFGRPAFYGLLLKPLTLLPYKTAYWVFQLGSLVSLSVFLKLNLHRFPPLGVLCAMSVPLFSNFANGQDVLYLLLFCSLSLYFAERGWDVAAGLILALCAIKAHLFVLVPLAVILKMRWRILAGGTLGAVILGLAGLAGGLAVQLELLKQLRNPQHSPYPDIMPNLRSLTGDHNSLFIVLAIAVYLTVGYLIYQSTSYEAAFGWALVGGVLGSFHAYVQDCLLLLLAFVLVHDELSKPAKALFYLVSAPFIYVALLAGHPYSGVFPAVVMMILALQVRESLRKRSAAPMLVEPGLELV
jgi:hypothetical protein